LFFASRVLLGRGVVVKHQQATRIEHCLDKGRTAEAFLNCHRHFVADSVPGSLCAKKARCLFVYGVLVGKLPVESIGEEAVNRSEVAWRLSAGRSKIKRLASDFDPSQRLLLMFSATHVEILIKFYLT
jgi:hypothetical protein